MSLTQASIPLLLGLDFDGVLSPGNSGTLRYAQNLADLLNGEFPQARVLLTTNWRRTNTAEELLDWLPPALADKVVGQAPLTDTGEAPGGRQREIEAWVRTRKIERLLAIDDTATLYAPNWKHLHLVDGRRALDAEAMACLRLALAVAPGWRD